MGPNGSDGSGWVQLGPAGYLLASWVLMGPDESDGSRWV
jgi:hypothetical protein